MYIVHANRIEATGAQLRCTCCTVESFCEAGPQADMALALQMRHMRSLRSMRRDNGWIHTLLEEAENERMVSHPAPSGSSAVAAMAASLDLSLAALFAAAALCACCRLH